MPLQCEYYALEGLTQLLATLDLIRDHLNPTLDIKGVVLTMYRRADEAVIRRSHEVRRHLGDRVFKTGDPAERPLVRGAEPRAADLQVRA
jgi:chromosome partitioning protein